MYQEILLHASAQSKPIFVAKFIGSISSKVIQIGSPQVSKKNWKWGEYLAWAFEGENEEEYWLDERNGVWNGNGVWKAFSEEEWIEWENEWENKKKDEVGWWDMMVTVILGCCTTRDKGRQFQ